MKLATNREIGVKTTTTSVISGLMETMKSRVPKIVISPVKNWVNPISRPSENWSISAIIRLMISPDGWESI